MANISNRPYKTRSDAKHALMVTGTVAGTKWPSDPWFGFAEAMPT